MTDQVGLKIEKFSGEKYDWRLWSELFKARLMTKDLLDVLLMDPEDIPDNKTSSTDSETKMLKEKNMRAYLELIGGMDMKRTKGRIAMNLVVATKSEKYPNGNCAQAWLSLKRKYSPHSAAEISILKKKYTNSRLKKGGDPDTFIDFLERTREQLREMGEEIGDRSFLTDLITKLNSDYENVIEKIQDMLDEEEDDEDLDIDKIRERLRSRYDRLNPGPKRFFKKNEKGKEEDDSEDEDEDEGAKAFTSFGGFKGKCFKCGKYGHKGRDCKGKRKKIVCYKCGKEGHIAFKCPENKTKETKTEDEKNEEAECVMIGIEEDALRVVPVDRYERVSEKVSEEQMMKNDQMKKMFIADTGASSHMMNSDKGMFNIREVNTSVKVGNGESLRCNKIGDVRIKVKQRDGKKDVETILKDVMYVPQLTTNLLSIGKALKQGWELRSKGEDFFLSKGRNTVNFDKNLVSNFGKVSGMDAEVVDLENESVKENGVMVDILKRGKDERKVKLTAEEAHARLGHVNEESFIKTAKYLGWEITGELKSCESCLRAKAKQKMIKKETEEKSSVPGERVFIDITPMKFSSLGGSRNWLLVVDDFSDFCWAFFLKRKDELAEKMISFVKEMRNKFRIEIKKIRMDGAGENISFKEEVERKGWGIQFELTGPGTPQHNGKVERKFATLFGFARAMMNYCGIEKNFRRGLWTEAAMMAVQIHNILIKNYATKTPSEIIFGENPEYAKSLRTFGEIGVVTYRKGFMKGTKVDNKGRSCMLLGYAIDHPSGTYRFYDFETRRVIISRDVKWLEKFYKDWRVKEDLGDESDESIWGYMEDEIVERTVEENEEEVIEFETESDSEDDNLKTPREVRKLRSFFNEIHGVEDVGITTRSGRVLGNQRVIEDRGLTTRGEIEDEIQLALVVHEGLKSLSGKKLKIDEIKSKPHLFKDVFEVPENFEDAWDHGDKFQRENWRKAVEKEIEKMERLDVWRKVKRSEMPENKRCVRYKWVFAIKRDGTFRARLVACGYSQIAGVDFTENFAPVINDVSYRVLLIKQMIEGLKCFLIDVETAFLHGELEETIFMECPKGLEHEDDEVLLLKKSLYGLVQAARQFHKKWSEILKKIGFEVNEADPCLFSKENRIFIGTYVDDNFVIGKDRDVREFIEDVRNEGLKLTVEEGLNDYLSCNIVFDESGRKAWIGQPHLLKKLEKDFGEEVKKMRIYKTPGTPMVGIKRPNTEEELLDPVMQRRLRSGIGCLLYLVKHSRPDIANSVRELSKCMDKGNRAVYKEMKRVIKFVLDTKDYGLKICPEMTRDYKLEVFVDADWAGDSDTRLSVSGFVMFLNGAIINWRSRAQRNVTLSSGESEYVSLSDCVKEIKFVDMLCKGLKIELERPIKVRVDNVSAIFMAETASASGRTRHIDVKYHHVRNSIEEGFIKVEFVVSEENYADIFTKNVRQVIYDEHKDAMIYKQEDMSD